MDLIASIEDELVHRQTVLTKSAGLIVRRTVDDIVAVNLLGSPIFGVCSDGEVQTRLDAIDGLRREERIVEVCPREVGQRVQLLHAIEESGSCLWP